MKTLHISARRWFQKTYGNTYHSVSIYIDGQMVHRVPFAYGYGEQWLQTAIDWLRLNGFPDAEYGTLYLRETLGGTYQCEDVQRKRDL